MLATRRNLSFMRNAVGASHVSTAAVVCRTRNSFPLGPGLRALPVSDLTMQPRATPRRASA